MRLHKNPMRTGCVLMRLRYAVSIELLRSVFGVRIQTVAGESTGTYAGHDGGSTGGAAVVADQHVAVIQPLRP